MEKQKASEIIKKLPDAPGVYLFLGTPKRSGGDWRGGKILYVGKATSLKDRVRSYFNQDIVNTRSPLISKMLSQFDDIQFIKTDSVLEALVLEANLIKKYQPEANIKEKDNRSFNYVVITDEDFPRVLIMRGRELEQIPTTEIDSFADVPDFSSKNTASESISFVGKKEKIRIFKTFGPFPNGSQLKEALKIVRKMFPFRDKCIPMVGRPCFNRQIGLCPGVCMGEISQKEYAQNIKNIILFFESKKQVLIKKLEKQMRDFAKARQFEKAQKIKKTIFTLGHIQDVSLIKDQVSKGTFDTNFRIESYDIAHLSGTNMVGAMTVLENGEIKKSDYRKFKIKWFDKLTTGNNKIVDDTRALSEVLLRRLAHIEWPKADLIVVDGGLAQKRAVEKILNANNTKIPVVSVVKDEHHKPKEILGITRLKNLKIENLEKQILLANAETHRFALGFHKQLRRAKMLA
ncbi:MAG: GIY-YIG nuclease family protein [Candidatus Paceibacterota bacterium]|jgi:excinuclease UvrABC nuclease subunit